MAIASFKGRHFYRIHRILKSYLRYLSVAPFFVYNMTLSGIYKRAVVYPGIILLFIATVFSIIENRDYESEWLTRETAIGMAIIAALLYGLLICLLASTIFLNRYKKVSSNGILSAFSWFLVPGGFICAVIGKAFNEYFTVGTTYEIAYAIVFNSPFLIGLIWGFRKFRR
jgi:hypothetical protein